MTDYMHGKEILKAQIRALLLAKDFTRADAIDLAADVFAAVQLRDALDFEMQTELIRLFREVSENPLEALEAVRKSNDALGVGHEDIDIFKLAVCGIEAMLLDLKKNRSEAGKKGGAEKNAKFDKLRQWGLTEAQKIHGSDKQIARKLVRSIPKDLAEISADPERFIYETLLAAKKK